MDDDHDDWIDNLEESAVKEKATDEYWKEIDSHPAFATKFDPTNISAEMEAIQAIKYEDPIDSAKSCKDEGNKNFKEKKYSLAIENYSAGLKLKVEDNDLNAILLTNRATAQFYLENYRSSINDCKDAIHLKPTHIKAHVRAAKANLQLNKVDECLEFCVSGLKVDKENKELQDLMREMMKQKAAIANKLYKKIAAVNEQKTEEDRLIALVKSRGVHVCEDLPPMEVPEAQRGCTHLDDEGFLHWPIVFLYPEFGQTDYLQNNVETSTLKDCLSMVFNEEQEPPSWDPQRVYRVNESLEVYYEDDHTFKMVPLSKFLKLREIYREKGFSVRKDLHLLFHVVSKKSKVFYKTWKETQT